MLALIRQAQQESKAKVFTVLRAVLTRWTSHYLAFRRLLDLKASLIKIAGDEDFRSPADKLFVQGKKESKENARKMLKRINGPNSTKFWADLVSLVRYLRPLSIAANVLQSSHARLDDVILTFGFLVLEFQAMSQLHNPQHKLAAAAVIDSVEKRWREVDQEVFIAAVIANPRYRFRPFARIDQLHRNGICALFERLFKRFFKRMPTSTFYAEISAYLDGNGTYHGIDRALESAESAALSVSNFSRSHGYI